MADDPQASTDSRSEPYFEPIGAGAPGPLPDEDQYDGDGDGDGDNDGRLDGNARSGATAFRFGVRRAAADWLAGMATLHFWAVAAGTICATWALVAALVLLPGTAGDSPEWVPAPLFVYLTASALLPATAALAAMHWGMTCYARMAAEGTLPGNLFSAVLAAAFRGLVLALLILLSLLLPAAAAAQSGTVAAISAGVAAVEGAFFGGMGVAVAALGRRTVPARVAGWALALFLVAGTVTAGALLVPAVRTEEPVTVALNVERAPDGRWVSYDCSGIPAGVSEVHRTERIMWLPAASPSVVFLMLAGEPGVGAELLRWMSAALQEAADGTQVPCVNGEPRSRDAPRMPLAAVGLFLQGGVAAALLSGAHTVADRRRPA